MSFVGIDFGNDSCVVAVARRRGGATIDVEVILNGVSKRETPSVVSFEGKHRLFGAAASASSTRNLTSTISQIKRLLGRSFSDQDLHKDLKSLPFKVTRAHDGYPLVHVSYLGKDEAFTPTQLLGMLLAHLKRIAVKDVDPAAPVQHWCVGIPVHFTDLQQRSVMDAAAIAGLTSVSLLHETAAAALDYSMVANLDDHAVVAFIDVGHASTQISISSLQILSHASDRSLGGRDFDEVLFRHFVAIFKEEYKIDVGKNNKASFKLRNECRKMKEKLTSNPEYRLSIESIMDGVDVKGRITKEEFEQLSAHLLQRLKMLLETAIADAALSVDEVKSFALVGAGSRVPAIVKTLNDFFGKEPRRTIIASECIARGCAVHCARLKITSKLPDQADPDLQKAIDREIKMGLLDRLVEETEEKKNSLEAYVYEIRDKLDGNYQEFVTGSEKEELIAKLQEVEDWLYEDGMDGTKDAYIAKLDQIKEQVNPIDERYKESVKRRSVVNQLVHCITNYKEEASSKDPKFDHIDGAEKQKVIAECEKAAEWLEDKEKEQALLPKHATPILGSTDLKRKAETLDGYDDKAPQLTDTGKQPVSSRKYRRIR